MLSKENAYLNAYSVEENGNPNGSLNGNPEGEKNTHLNRINVQADEKVTSETSHVHLIPFYDAIAVAGRRSGANMEAVTVPA